MEAAPPRKLQGLWSRRENDHGTFGASTSHVICLAGPTRPDPFVSSHSRRLPDLSLAPFISLASALFVSPMWASLPVTETLFYFLDPFCHIDVISVPLHLCPNNHQTRWLAQQCYSLEVMGTNPHGSIFTSDFWVPFRISRIVSVSSTALNLCDH